MSLLKTNEIQNYNGSSLTLTASTVSTSAQLNTGGNISVTGSLNVSDDSTTRSNLGLGTIATQDSDSITVTGGTATLGALTVSGSDSGDLVRITQTGSGNALVVEDSSNPDSTPFVVDASGNVGIATSNPSYKLEIAGSAQSGNFFIQPTAGTIGMADNSASVVFYDATGAGGDTKTIKFFTDNYQRMLIDSSGNITITQAPGKYTIDTAPSAISVANNGTVDFSSASGMLLVNNHSNGSVTLWLCGGGTTVAIGNTTTSVGSFAYNSGVNAYRWTNNSGSTASFGFQFFRTRTST